MNIRKDEADGESHLREKETIWMDEPGALLSRKAMVEEKVIVLNQKKNNGVGGEHFAQAREQSGLPTWKRGLDLAVIVLLLPGALLIGLAVALVVKCGSRGPVFFRQRRVGYKGREFVCYKFRTMLVDADISAHKGHTTQLIREGRPMTKLDAGSDPRLIPFGAALRAPGLDELPQLLNVLRGEMSIVGPRPCVPYEYELYEPWQRRRFDAVPGLTGLWQVSGKNRTTFSQMIHLDIEYSRRKSLWFDLRILFKTLPALWVQCADMIEKKKLKPTAVPQVGGMSKSVQSHT